MMSLAMLISRTSHPLPAPLKLGSRVLQLLQATFLSLILVACDQAEPQAQQNQAIQEVGVVVLKRQSLELFTELNGRTTPYRVSQVRPQVTGVVLKREFEEGSQVTAGQTLYQIDAKAYAAEFARAKADLAKAEAAVKVEELRTQRLKTLLDDEAISAQAYDDASATLTQAQAQVAVAKAALQTARINLDYTTVKAPIDGRISRSFITEGALVTANQTAELAQVTQLDPIYVDIARSSEELLQLKQALRDGKLKQADAEKASIQLQLEDGSNYPTSGQLQFSEITVNADTATVTLRALFSNPNHDLLPGMFVRVHLSEGVKDNALLVPQRGVTHNRQGEATALVVNAEGEVELRRLTKSRAIGNDWLVEDGLAAGDKVIVNRLQSVRPGDKVKAVPTSNKASKAAPANASGESADHG